MLTLYHFPQLCSLATHVVLEELGLPYQLKVVDILKGEQREPGFLALNRYGQVPVLVLDDGTALTETIAILDYLAQLAPEFGLAPTAPVERARWLAVMGRMASAIHPTFTRVVRPDMIVDDEVARPAVSAAARDRYAAHLEDLNRVIGGGPWVLGERYTTADAHALVMVNWGQRAGFALGDHAHLCAWKDRMLARPAVRTVLEREGSPLLEPARGEI